MHDCYIIYPKYHFPDIWNVISDNAESKYEPEHPSLSSYNQKLYPVHSAV